MTGARLAHAKINLALVVGPVGANGKHELTTVFQRVALADRLELEPADALTVEGFEDDSLVRGALEALAAAAAVEPAWHVRIEKEIPVAAGLGGGSSDAAAALVLANETLDEPLPPDRLHELAARLGADVPFFLKPGPQLGEGDGSRLTPVEIPQSRTVVLVIPGGAAKESTASVYRSFDERNGAHGYEERRAALLAALVAGDLAALPRNDLASSPLAERLEELGALRADVSGAGPAVYGLFADEAAAAEAVRGLGPHGWAWIGQEAW
jgi:4-diphosphocytidyl-2-C-methyl-D-erythritol kinase